MPVDYDQLAEQYKKYRKPDPKIAARIQFHIQGAQRVLNVGAGMGSYEPEDCEVVAIEPSYEMIAKRKRAKATLIQGFAEDLPFIDNGFDISMGILTIHHWSDSHWAYKKCSEYRKIKLCFLPGLDTAAISVSRNIYLK